MLFQLEQMVLIYVSGSQSNLNHPWTSGRQFSDVHGGPAENSIAERFALELLLVPI